MNTYGLPGVLAGGRERATRRYGMSDRRPLVMTASTGEQPHIGTRLLDRCERWLGRLSVRTWSVVSVAVGALFAGLLLQHHVSQIGMTIDGQRWFWLDDDQMISMRYARNLVEGHGLVWNPEESPPVEGYTNFLWTLVMAAVLATGVSLQVAPVVILVVNYGLLILLLVQSVRLVRALVPEARLAQGLATACILTCLSVVFWAFNGAEGTLVGLLQMTFLVSLFNRNEDMTVTPVGLLALALVPLVRADALYIWASNVALGVFVSKRRGRDALLLLATAAPALAHTLWRFSYYGQWLPNTYYLKVEGRPNTFGDGWGYLRSFLLGYSVPLIVAAGAALVLSWRDRRGVALFTTVGATCAYVLIVGSDTFKHFRFFAHALPVIFVFAAAGAHLLTRARAGGLVLGLVVLAVSVPWIEPFRVLASPSMNGDPYTQVPVAALLSKNARPDSTVAVIPAGIVPYYTGMKSVDLLGKSDPHVAHSTYRPNTFPGHAKWDTDHSFGRLEPDLFVSCQPFRTVANAPARVRKGPQPYGNYLFAILASEAFRDSYLGNRIVHSPLDRTSAVYAHEDSPEANGRKSWEPIAVVAPPAFRDGGQPRGGPVWPWRTSAGE